MARPLYNLSLSEWETFKISREAREGRHWRIKQFEIDPMSPEYAVHQMDGRSTGTGMFTALHFRKDHPDYPTVYQHLRNNEWDAKNGWIPMMSDTQAEILDHYPLLDKAWWGGAEVLITGLGLGMVAEACLGFGNNVTVVERDPEVIDLIADQIAHPNLRIVQADAMTWKPDQHFDLAWHDIWPTITMLNLPSMRAMRKHYGRAVRGWQGFWGWEQVLYMDRMENRTDPTGMIRFLGRTAFEELGRMWNVNREATWKIMRDAPYLCNLSPRQTYAHITGLTPPGERILP